MDRVGLVHTNDSEQLCDNLEICESGNILGQIYKFFDKIWQNCVN